METKSLRSALVTYEDGSFVLLNVEDAQGFHRISEFSNGATKLTIHEIFITYGTEPTDAGLTI